MTQNRLNIARLTYKEVKAEWDKALAKDNGAALAVLEDPLMEAEDKLREAFLQKLATEATPAEMEEIKRTAYSEKFIAIAAR